MELLFDMDASSNTLSSENVEIRENCRDSSIILI